MQGSCFCCMLVSVHMHIHLMLRSASGDSCSGSALSSLEAPRAAALLPQPIQQLRVRVSMIHAEKQAPKHNQASSPAQPSPLPCAHKPLCPQPHFPANPAQAINNFCREVGVTRSEGEVHLHKLEHHIR